MLSRKALVAILSLSLIVATLLIGCGAAATATPAPTATPAATEAPAATAAAPASSKPFDGTSLNILMESVPDTEVIEPLLAQFKAETGITVNIEKVQYGVMHEKLVPQLTSPEGSGSYDILEVDNYWVGEFVSAGWIFPLDDRIKQTPHIKLDNYIPAMMATNGQVNGVTYLLPMWAYPMGLVYRTDLISDPAFLADYKARFGKDFDVNALTLPEYVEFAKFVQNRDGRYGSAMQGQRYDPIAMEWMNYLYAMGGDVFDQNMKPVINSEAGVKAAELYVDLLKNGAPPGAAQFNLDDANNVFGQDKAWSMVSYNFMFTWLNDPKQSQVVGKARMIKMPGQGGMLGGWGWAIPKSSPHPDAAWEFIKWVERPDIALARGLAGGMPTRLDVYNNPEFQAKYPFQKDFLEIIKVDKPVPQIARSPQMIETIGTNMSEAVAGTKSPQQALDDAAKELGELVK